MANVCVITGGGSGIGLEAAKNISKEKILVLAGNEVETLESAVQVLRTRGYTVFAKYCDVFNPNSVNELAEFARGLGKVKQVIHTMELTAAATKIEWILQYNILSTAYINRVFSKAMQTGGVIVDLGSYAAYEPAVQDMPSKVYALLETDGETFWQKMLKKVHSLKDESQQKDLAYALSKHFVLWYAKKWAVDLADKGIRVLTVSPGLLEVEGAEEKTEETSTPQPRLGKTAEVGYLLATVADERNGYLVGVDVLCDGGRTTRTMEFKK